jgi:isoleucyl-tRNA synthetase
VHLEAYPVAKPEWINEKLEQGVALLEEAILLARGIREKEKIKVKLPLKELVLIHRKEKALEALKPLESYLLSELNVRKISYRQDETSFVEISVKPNGQTLGPKVGRRMKELSEAIARLGVDQLQELETKGHLSVLDVSLSPEDVKILRTPVKGAFATQASSKLAVALDIGIDRDQSLEGMAREIVNRVQRLRKDSALSLDDRIELELRASGDLKDAALSFETYIKDQTLAVKVEVLTDSMPFKLPHQAQEEVEGLALGLALRKLEREKKIS